MSINYTKIGKRIQENRRHRGLSQMTLSEMIDCSPGFVSYIENDVRKMSLDTFIAIANALNTSSDELLVDCIDNTIMAYNHAFAELISDCSDFEVKVLVDIASATKESLRKHRPNSGIRYK